MEWLTGLHTDVHRYVHVCHCCVERESLLHLPLHTHSSPLVTVKNVEHLPVEGDIDAEVEVFPVPSLP